MTASIQKIPNNSEIFFVQFYDFFLAQENNNLYLINKLNVTSYFHMYVDHLKVVHNST